MFLSCALDFKEWSRPKDKIAFSSSAVRPSEFPFLLIVNLHKLHVGALHGQY